MADIQYQIHWLAVTVHAPSDDAMTIYNTLFKETFGELESLGHGGRSFKEIYHGLLEFKLYLKPVGQGEFFHFEIPGQACECITWEYFKALGELLEGNYPEKYNFTRLDFAFDYVPFSPEQVEQAIKDGDVRSLAKRETLSVNSSPFEKRDNGEIGTYTVNFGSRSSERMIRVYNRRGFTRLEFQTKDRRANVIVKQLFRCAAVSEWASLMVGHVRDFVDFGPNWWKEFTQGNLRAWETVSSPKETTKAKLIHWIDKQISPALSVAVDILPEYAMKAILDQGRKRRGARYDLLLQAHGKGA